MEKGSVLLRGAPYDREPGAPLNLTEISTPDLSKVAKDAASTVLEEIAEVPAFLYDERAATGPATTVGTRRTGERIDDRTENLDPENE